MIDTIAGAAFLPAAIAANEAKKKAKRKAKREANKTKVAAESASMVANTKVYQEE